ncbi:MAG: AAA family ATPase [Candidatus Heimdallarchaeota archaeon]|nr:AAA family ATPase [Candidatus Heimdallarchaeota archaeon]MCK4955176.1 AAA family ATPase [Candidatus Heimdallarchaeota archaeon]
MKTISVHSYKGGTGKTTFLLNIAGLLAKSGKKILAVDYDLRAPSFQSYFKLAEPRYLSNYLIDDHNLSEIIIPCKTDQKDILDLIFSSMEFLQQHSKQRDQLSRDDAKFLAKLYQLQQEFKNEYDYLLLDTIPGFFYRSIDALMVSDIILVVANPSTSNVLGIQELCKNIYSMLREDSKMILLINKIEEEGIEADKEIFEKNLSKLKKIGKENFDDIIEVPYFSILSERIHAFEDQPHEEFLEMIKQIIKIV